MKSGGQIRMPLPYGIDRRRTDRLTSLRNEAIMLQRGPAKDKWCNRSADHREACRDMGWTPSFLFPSTFTSPDEITKVVKDVIPNVKDSISEDGIASFCECLSFSSMIAIDGVLVRAQKTAKTKGIIAGGLALLGGMLGLALKISDCDKPKSPFVSKKSISKDRTDRVDVDRNESTPDSKLRDIQMEWRGSTA